MKETCVSNSISSLMQTSHFITSKKCTSKTESGQERITEMPTNYNLPNSDFTILMYLDYTSTLTSDRQIVSRVDRACAHFLTYLVIIDTLYVCRVYKYQYFHARTYSNNASCPPQETNFCNMRWYGNFFSSNNMGEVKPTEQMKKVSLQGKSHGTMIHR